MASVIYSYVFYIKKLAISPKLQFLLTLFLQNRSIKFSDNFQNIKCQYQSYRNLEIWKDLQRAILYRSVLVWVLLIIMELDDIKYNISFALFKERFLREL